MVDLERDIETVREGLVHDLDRGRDGSSPSYCFRCSEYEDACLGPMENAALDRLEQRLRDDEAIAIQATEHGMEALTRVAQLEASLERVLDNIAYVEGEEPFTSARNALREENR